MRPFRPALLACLAALLTGAPTLRASDPLPEPAGNHSATVTAPHVTAELITETSSLQIGKPFEVALHLHMDPDWHTYWINPGDAGLATTIKWTLPPGIQSAGPIQWPTPEKHSMGPLTTYGYGGDVYLLTTFRPISALAGYLPHHLDIRAHVDWLVCQEACIPGKADLTVPLDFDNKPTAPDPAREAFFQAARDRLPVPNASWGNWGVTGAYRGDQLILHFTSTGNLLPGGRLSFFVEQPNVVDPKSIELQPDGGSVGPTEMKMHVSLVQNGEKPDHLSGVLVSDQLIIQGTHHPIFGDHSAISIASFPVTGGTSPPSAASAPVTTNASSAALPATPVAVGSNPSVTPGAPSSNPATAATPYPENATSSSNGPTLAAVLGFAFLGGLVLNLMPCVLPVLSLKVFSLIRHAGDHSGSAWKQGAAFTAGVVISFWVLAGLLIVLESAGQHLGWGFQMQSPGFVLALTFLFFLLGLNLFGVFELGTSLVGLDAKATSHLAGLPSSFANGALAVLAATPCTAPFMGSAVGFAAGQPAFISLLVFTVLALGMAAPYLALTVFPGALRLVPKPGAWMEALRQFMGFLLMGTVIFLVYVFGALVGTDDVPMLLGTLLLAALAAWIFGRGTGPVHSSATRLVSTVAALLLLTGAIAEGARLTHDVPDTTASTASGGWQVYSPAAVQQALTTGHPAFVDFTAAWCLSCKVNEKVALDIDSTKKLFAQRHVALFRGDWTHSDPQITKTLREFNRDGVPLYLFYSSKNPTQPTVLPAVLTPDIVRDAVLERQSSHGEMQLVMVSSVGILVLIGLAALLVHYRTGQSEP
jgi:thiol:disulfide interchange protein/DsbC/DsbD-like thiol-disulfide interchange protein